MFQADVFALLKNLKKSPRGEYEITDVLDYYAKRGELSHSILESTWTDAGTFESLYNATVLMKKNEENEGK
jgi:glucose-1-phosphate thymidylyltransferase